MTDPVIVAGTLMGLSNLGDGMVVPRGRHHDEPDPDGLDTLNTCKTQKRTSPGGAFVDQVTYKSNQFSTKVPVLAGEEWRVATVKLQTFNEIRYVMYAAPAPPGPPAASGDESA
jgi:hypothetical protein